MAAPTYIVVSVDNTMHLYESSDTVFTIKKQLNGDNAAINDGSATLNVLMNTVAQLVHTIGSQCRWKRRTVSIDSTTLLY